MPNMLPTPEAIALLERYFSDAMEKKHLHSFYNCCGKCSDQRPLSTIPCASVAESSPIYPLKDMKVLFTENCNKAARIVNGQEATVISAQNNTIVLRLPEGQRVFVYPVTHIEDERPVTYYAFTPAYAQTITKSQGQNIKHLIVWLDSDLVPAGTAYVGFSRVRKRANISFLQPIHSHQVTPVRV